MTHEVISYVLSGLAIAIALFFLMIPKKDLGKKVALVAGISAAIGIFAPTAGFYIFMVELVVLFITFMVSMVRGLKNIRW